ncbi:hypothetical protein HBI56_225240 [Parastagonospora nodorum]|nr:hypothetical protein HBH56_238860 [Parastagonospora nodorum]KAH3921643.1 hypothetical protein HBH54_237170 [Parastagonospora nodorum]KAH3939760.1 hypothetical protein HBH53_229090 [Parastagonospora nodorum]KAH3957885.1 hypothetical protein HBH51_217640 [Parastagonospora nodorum]KAH3967437.1 hypothetical protein HBH52_186870 [Parastagonospora nodorum]
MSYSQYSDHVLTIETTSECSIVDVPDPDETRELHSMFASLILRACITLLIIYSSLKCALLYSPTTHPIPSKPPQSPHYAKDNLTRLLLFRNLLIRMWCE